MHKQLHVKYHVSTAKIRDKQGMHAMRLLAAHLEHNLFHLLIWGLELSDQDDHHLPCVVVCVHGVHERNDEANGLQKSCQHLSSQAMHQSRV